MFSFDIFIGLGKRAGRSKISATGEDTSGCICNYYSQVRVLPFPNGIKAEATSNSEMHLIVDVDIEQLKHLHMSGSVRNLKDRRNDLYELKLKL